jgi:hypothetical protein
LFFYSFEVKSQLNYNKVKDITHEILSFNFQKADSLISRIDKEFENDYLFSQLKTNYYWWILISGNDTENIRNLFELNAESTIQNINNYKGLKRDCFWSPNFNYFISHGYLTRLYALSSSYFNLLSNASSMLNIIEKTLVKTEECDCFKLSSGLFHYFIQTARNESNFYKAGLVFFPESRIEYGIRLLNESSKSENSLIRSESNYFLARIYHENDLQIDSALYHYNILTNEYPNNLIYLYYELNAMLKAKLPKELLKEKRQKAIYSINENSQLVLNQSNYFKKLFQEIEF